MTQCGRLLVAALVFALLPAALHAQVTTAALAGTVFDGSGAVIPNAEAVILNVDTGISRTMRTSGEGRFEAPNLAVGRYEVVVTATGFKTAIRNGVTLTVGQRAVLSFTLEPGALSEQVTVVSQGAQVDTSSSQVGALVSQAQIKTMPLNGRDYTQLAALQPGVVPYREQEMNVNRGLGTRFSIGGARHNQIGYRLNGIDINDGAGTTPGSATGRNLGVDAIQEFQVLTNTFTAEQGRSAGGVINIVHKSGGNQMHGSLFEYHRNSAMDKKNYFDSGSQPPPFKRNQFGFSGGGPVIHNRTFFFGAYEGLRESLTSTVSAIVLAQSTKDGALGTVDPRMKPYLSLMPAPNGALFANGTGELRSTNQTRSHENYFVGKLDHTFSQSDSLSGSVTFDKGDVARPNNLATWTEGNTSNFKYLTLQHTHTFSPNLLHTLRGGFNSSRHFDTRDPITSAPEALRFVPGTPAGTLDVPGIETFDIPFAPYVFRELNLESYQVGNTLTWLRGRNTFKTGMEFSHFEVSNTSFGRTGGGNFGFDSIANFLAARPATFEATDPDSTIGRAVINQGLFGFFAQDDIRMRSNLTMNLGLRYEFITEPKSNGDNQSNLVSLDDPKLTTTDSVIRNPSLKNIAPRGGFAWDVFGNQKTALRGGLGIYHDQITSYYYLPAIESNPPFRLSRRVPNAVFPTAFNEISSGTSTSLFSLTLLEHDLKQPYRVQYNLGLQQQLTNNMAVAVYYVGGRGVNSSMFYLNANSRRPSGVSEDGSLMFNTADPRRNPNFSTIQYRAMTGSSWYDSLQLMVQQRPNKGLGFQLSYTLQKSTDTGSVLSYSTEGLNTVGAQSIFAPVEDEKGLSAFDVRHTFSANATYDLPWGDSWTGIARALGAGWQVSGIINLASGHPFTPVLAFDNAGTTVRSRGDDQRPDLAPGGNANPVSPGNVDHYFDITQFVLPPAGTLGDLPRNTLIGPGLATVDVSLKKRVQIFGSRTAEFRTEAFNILNHANFRIPTDRAIIVRGGGYNPNAGRITATSTTSRQIQVSARFEF